MEKKRKGLLERLRDGVVLGDGGMIFELEKRGYVKVGVWTPECTALHPDAGTVRKYFEGSEVNLHFFVFLQSDRCTETSLVAEQTSAKR